MGRAVLLYTISVKQDVVSHYAVISYGVCLRAIRTSSKPVLVLSRSDKEQTNDAMPNRFPLLLTPRHMDPSIPTPWLGSLLWFDASFPLTHFLFRRSNPPARGLVGCPFGHWQDAHSNPLPSFGA